MRDAVIGIVLAADKKIVLTKRSDAPIWVLPGGGIDPGEDPETAILREIKEETGLNVAISYKCAEYTPSNSLTAKTHVFECLIESGALQNSEETEEIALFEMNNFPKPFFILHQAWLNDWQFCNGKMVQKQITQVTYLSIAKFFFCHPIILLKFLCKKYLSNQA